MIVLDTQCWIWWVMGNRTRLSNQQLRVITRHESDQIGVSANSCWEVAKLVELKKIQLPLEIEEWVGSALQSPGISLLELSPEIAIESTRLPGGFHRDPADQIIVATARIFGCPLLTTDERIRSYPHVETVY